MRQIPSIVLALQIFQIIYALPSAKFKYFDSRENRIVGGENTTIEQHPYVLSMQYFGNHACGASILSNEWVITAAHCFGSSDPLMDFLTVRAGTSFHGRGGTQHLVERIIRHENFSTPYDFDIALLKLKEPLIFNEVVQPINIPEQDEYLEPGSIAEVTGWGLTYVDPFLPEQLQVVSLSVISHEDCSKLYGDAYTPNMVCAHYPPGGKDACNGDSGGPMVVDGKQVGIVSWGPTDCGHPIYPGVYTRMSRFRTWITKHTGI